MDQFTNEELLELIRKATAGDRKALETVLVSVQDLVFNLSLRMLGTFPDAEDATQDILLKIMTRLSSFRGESAFSTWVFRIASNYLKTFRAHISAEGKLPVPVGYYLTIRPGGGTFLGGGLFADMFRDATEMVRGYIAEHGDEFEAIIHAPAFEEHFRVQGTSLKKVPAGYDREHPQAEYLKYKSWYLEYPMADEAVEEGEAFVSEAVRLFRIMKPFNDYLNRALVGFRMPER
nr:DUF2461 family protein [uncultured Acetatifactor sp.]